MRKRVVACAVTLLVAVGAVPASAAHASDGFVARHGSRFVLDGKTFRFGGTNNYYLMYKSPLMVDDVFADAKAAGFTVLRTWGFLDIGNQDGSNSVRGKQEGIYFQYWDGDSPAYNDGPDGLAKLDYVLHSARQHGIKLIIPLTNNWNDFGGMDQYVRWAGGQFHDDFYSNPVIRGWFKDWISHVVNRVNPLTGLAYKDDPTVMAWELGNEPRCLSAGAYPRSPNCTTQTLVGWADEITRHVKSVDPRHLVGVGDEGFFCDDPAHEDWTRNCGEGVDTLAFTRLPAVDMMSFHIYPAAWGKDLPWTFDWITRHVREADRIGKPVLWGEFGWLDKATRNVVYQKWTDLFDSAGGDGWLYWILSDHDTAVTLAGEAVTLAPTANDIAYRTKVRPASVDLDPAVAGQQTAVTVPGGQYVLGAAGVVTFTPAEGFQGRSTAHYTIRDQAGRMSDVADLVVTVRPAPGDPVTIASFETGVEGFVSAPWQTNAGTTAQQPDFHTNGAQGLRINGVDGGWFGLNLPAPLDLSGKAFLRCRRGRRSSRSRRT